MRNGVVSTFVLLDEDFLGIEDSINTITMILIGVCGFTALLIKCGLKAQFRSTVSLVVHKKGD